MTALRPVSPADDQEEDGERWRDNAAALKTTKPITLPSSHCTELRRPERTITVANPDLLMKLFDVVDTGHKLNPSLTAQFRRARSVIRNTQLVYGVLYTVCISQFCQLQIDFTCINMY